MSSRNEPDQPAFPVLSPRPELAASILDAFGAANLGIEHATHGPKVVAVIVPHVVFRADFLILTNIDVVVAAVIVDVAVVVIDVFLSWRAFPHPSFSALDVDGDGLSLCPEPACDTEITVKTDRAQALSTDFFNL